MWIQATAVTTGWWTTFLYIFVRFSDHWRNFNSIPPLLSSLGFVFASLEVSTWHFSHCFQLQLNLCNSVNFFWDLWRIATCLGCCPLSNCHCRMMASSKMLDFISSNWLLIPKKAVSIVYFVCECFHANKKRKKKKTNWESYEIYTFYKQVINTLFFISNN